MIDFSSPCESICAIDETGMYCIGCMRTQEEIFSWMTFPQDERDRITEEVKTRKPTTTKENNDNE